MRSITLADRLSLEFPKRRKSTTAMPGDTFLVYIGSDLSFKVNLDHHKMPPSIAGLIPVGYGNAPMTAFVPFMTSVLAAFPTLRSLGVVVE